MGLNICAYSHLEYVRPLPGRPRPKSLATRIQEFPSRAWKAIQEEPSLSKAWKRMSRQEPPRTSMVLATSKDDDLIPIYKIKGWPNMLNGHKEGLYQRTDKTVEFCTGNIPYSSFHNFRQMLSVLQFHMTYDDLFAAWEEGHMVAAGIVKMLCYPDVEGCFGPETAAEIAEDMERRKNLIHAQPWMCMERLEDEDRAFMEALHQKEILDDYKGLYDDILHLMKIGSLGGFVTYQ